MDGRHDSRTKLTLEGRRRLIGRVNRGIGTGFPLVEQEMNKDRAFYFPIGCFCPLENGSLLNHRLIHKCAALAVFDFDDPEVGIEAHLFLEIF